VKWNFDSIFFKFSDFLKKLVLLCCKTFLRLLFNTSSSFFKFIFLNSNPLFYKLCKPLKFFINTLLFFFITIPWWFLGEVIKPNLFTVYIFCKKFLNKFPTLTFFFKVFTNSVNLLFTYLLVSTKKFKKKFKKKLIDFLYFNIFRKRNFYFIKIFILLKFLFYFFLFYLFFYKNLISSCFYFFIPFDLEYMIVLNFDSYLGILQTSLFFLNPENIIILIYLIFIKVGVLNILFYKFDDSLVLLSYNWTTFFVQYKLQDINFSVFKLFFDTTINSLLCIELNTITDFDNTPLFFFFGSFFFTTVVFSWFFFSYLGLYGIFQLNFISLFLFWVSLLLCAKSVFVDQKIYLIKLCNWVFLSLNVKIDYYFLIDSISFSFILLTTTIAFFVFIYAFSYFRYEPLVDRFLLFLLSFVISMIFLVASGNTIMLFLGWELIGFTSFCLINFWTTKTATLKSAFKAFTFNKISDFFMFIFLVATYSVYYTFDILSLNNQVFKYEALTIYIFGTSISYLEFIAFLLIGAAFIKSAQFGGHAWLPDSMEAPVPASSLIHSATLVSAGVYLILRFNFIFDATEYSKLIIPVVGSLTAAYGGICAIAQSDIKKTLAYSTISHCGFLMVLCATEMNEFTILYLYVHGFFKAGVFMCVGNVLRIARGYQDTRRMGGLLKYLPFEYFCATIGLLNLAGLPFTFGFFIKHLLLVSLDTHMYIYYFVMFHSLIGAFAGLFYSFRIINYTFCDFKKGNKNLYLNLNRPNYNSSFYTNTSLAATISILLLFSSSFIITYFMFKYFIFSNFIFSDFMNTTILTNYYSITSAYGGYLFNFSYINLTVIFILLSLYFSKYRKIQRPHILFLLFSSYLLFFLNLFMFFNLL